MEPIFYISLVLLFIVIAALVDELIHIWSR